MRDCNIIFTYQDNSGDFHIETLKASKSGTCYKIRSIPLFTPSISLEDIVCASEQEEELHFDMVLEPSGHSTIQVVFFDENYIEPALEDVQKLGCSCEISRAKNLVAVDIPTDVQYSLVQHYFEKGEEEGRWTYKESCLAHY